MTEEIKNIPAESHLSRDPLPGEIDAVMRIAHLEDVLRRLLDRYDSFLSGDRNQAEAYYSFYKGHYSLWDEARKLVPDETRSIP